MNVGIFPNEELATNAMMVDPLDILIYTGFAGCCQTAVMVPIGPYSDIFEDIWDDYKPQLRPKPYNCYMRNNTLSEVLSEIKIAIPEAVFDNRIAGV